MEIDTLEYSRVKATLVSVRLRIYLCALKIPNIGHDGRRDVTNPNKGCGNKKASTRNMSIDDGEGKIAGRA
jgi:glycerate kinase